jgi:hypothetical protein
MFARYITRIRLSADHFSVETERYNKNGDATRVCYVCKDVTGGEFHFILKCPLYNDLRKQYIKPYFWKKSSTFKLVKLLCTYNLKQLRHLGAYMFKDVKLRTITVSLLTRCVYYVFTMYVNILQLSFCPCMYWLIYIVCTDEPIGSKSIQNWNVTTKRWAWPPSYTHVVHTRIIYCLTQKSSHRKKHI